MCHDFKVLVIAKKTDSLGGANGLYYNDECSIEVVRKMKILKSENNRTLTTIEVEFGVRQAPGRWGQAGARRPVAGSKPLRPIPIRDRVEPEAEEPSSI